MPPKEEWVTTEELIRRIQDGVMKLQKDIDRRGLRLVGDEPTRTWWIAYRDGPRESGMHLILEDEEGPNDAA